MNAKKLLETIYSSGNMGDLQFDLLLNQKSIPYNPNSVFLIIALDENLRTESAQFILS